MVALSLGYAAAWVVVVARAGAGFFAFSRVST
jgi:hypothetical protein